jgi:TolB-like protein
LPTDALLVITARALTARLALLAALCTGLLVTFCTQPLASAQKPRTIAIAYFDNNTGSAELEPLRKGLADMLITDLARLEKLQIVERERLNQVLGELKLSKSKFIDPKTAQKLGKGLAAELIMTGSFALSGDVMRVDVRVIEVQTAKIAASDKVEGRKQDFFAIEKDLVDVLVKTLDLKLSSGERSGLRSNATQSFDAWRKYSAGLDAKDRGDDAEAQRLFLEALAADPNYQAAQSASERLQVIFARSDAAKEADIAQRWKALNPKAEDFAREVNELFVQLEGAAHLKQRIALLTHLAERDLAPSLVPEFSRVQMEVASLLSTFDQMPGAREQLLPVCEYLLSRFPKNLMAEKQCRHLVQMITFYEKMDLAERKQRWSERWAKPGNEDELAMRDAMPDILKLFRLYGRKARQP